MGHVLDHMQDHVLDHIMIGLMTMVLYLCWNFSPTGKDKLAGVSTRVALICGSGTFTHIFAMSHAFTLAPTPILDTVAAYSVAKNFYAFWKIVWRLKINLKRPRERCFKIHFPDFYKNKLYINYFHFLQ